MWNNSAQIIYKHTVSNIKEIETHFAVNIKKRVSIMNATNMKSAVNRLMQSTAMIGLIVLIAISCNDINSSEPGKARLDVSLTDAPADYQEVNVDVQGLRIHHTAESDTSDDDGEWVDLPVEPMTVNLLELTNGVDTLLASAELEPGSYSELRLILGDENTVMIDSVTHDLRVPSGQQSGYKIKFDTELEEGEELDVVIDFDAGRSVHKAGNSGKYILKPVLKAFVEDDDLGSITGAVEPVEANPAIYAIMNDDTTGTQADEDGEFLLQGLESGEYDLKIEPSNEYSDTTLSNITVDDGEEADVGLITLNND